MPTQKFWVKGLTRADEDAVKRRVMRVDGVFFAVLDHGAQCAEVEFDDGRASLDEIRAAIREAGYDAEAAG